MSSGIAIDRIVRGWRSRRPSETWSVTSPSSPAAAAGAVDGAGTGAAPGGTSAPAGRAGGVGHVGITRLGHAAGPALPAGGGTTRRLPRARLTSFEIGVRVRTI